MRMELAFKNGKIDENEINRLFPWEILPEKKGDARLAVWIDQDKNAKYAKPLFDYLERQNPADYLCAMRTGRKTKSQGAWLDNPFDLKPFEKESPKAPRP